MRIVQKYKPGRSRQRFWLQIQGSHVPAPARPQIDHEIISTAILPLPLVLKKGKCQLP